MIEINEDPELAPEEAEDKAKKVKKRNSDLLSLYRTASRNHVSFVEINDRRANILISTCALIISVSFSIFLRGALQPTAFLIPGVILIITCTVTMILAMLSTRPYSSRQFYSIFKGKTEAPPEAPNLLFFQNFYKMQPSEYETALSLLVGDQVQMQQAVMRDLHGLGQSVARKFKYLRFSYDVLMVGVILAVLTMFVVLIRQHQGAGAF